MFLSILPIITFENSDNPIGRKAALCFSLLAIIAVSGMRGSSVGVDNFGYYEWYINLSQDIELLDTITLNIMDFEPGFVTFNYILKSYDLGYNWAESLYSLLIWGPIYFYSKYIKNFYFAIFSFISLGFLFFTFNGQRQAIATGFIFLGTIFLFEEKKWLFILSILIATTFHFSAILMFVIFFIFKIPRLSTNFWGWAIFLSLLFPLSTLFGIIEKIASLFPFYGSYIQNENFTQANPITAGVIYQVLLELIILIYFKKFSKSLFELKIFNIFFISAIGFNLTYGNLFLSRVAIYLLFFQPFVLAIILYKLKLAGRKVEVLGIMIILFVLYIYKIQMSDSGCSPYIFFNKV